VFTAMIVVAENLRLIDTFVANEARTGREPRATPRGPFAKPS